MRWRICARQRNGKLIVLRRPANKAEAITQVEAMLTRERAGGANIKVRLDNVWIEAPDGTKYTKRQGAWRHEAVQGA